MMLDINSLIAPAFTAMLTGLGVYVGMSNQVVAIRTELANLTKQVEKHNSTVERTYKLESDSSTMWRRIDELRKELERIEAKVDGIHAGGTE